MEEPMEQIGREFCTRGADMQIAAGEEDAECPYAEESVTRRG